MIKRFDVIPNYKITAKGNKTLKRTILLNVRQGETTEKDPCLNSLRSTPPSTRYVIYSLQLYISFYKFNLYKCIFILCIMLLCEL
jgi:hypothetical protein